MAEGGTTRGRGYVTGTTLVLAVVGVGASALVASMASLRVGGDDVASMVALVGQPAVLFAAAAVVAVCAAGMDSRFCRFTWAAVALGVVAAAAGDLAWGYAELVEGARIAYPGPLDAVYAVEYVALAGATCAMVLSLRNRVELVWPATEALVVTAAIGVLVYYGVALPTIGAAREAASAATTASILYVAADVVLLIGPAITLLLALVRVDERALRFPWSVFAAGMLVIALSDLGWFRQEAVIGWDPGSLVDFAWMVGHVMLATAASLQLDEARARELATKEPDND